MFELLMIPLLLGYFRVAIPDRRKGTANHRLFQRRRETDVAVDWRALGERADQIFTVWLMQHNDYSEHRCWECGPVRDWLRAWEEVERKESRQ